MLQEQQQRQNKIFLSYIQLCDDSSLLRDEEMCNNVPVHTDSIVKIHRESEVQQ